MTLTASCMSKALEPLISNHYLIFQDECTFWDFHIILHLSSHMFEICEIWLHKMNLSHRKNYFHMFSFHSKALAEKRKNFDIEQQTNEQGECVCDKAKMK